MKTASKIIGILSIIAAPVTAIVSLAIGETKGAIYAAILLILGLLILLKAKKGEYEIDYVVNAGHKNRKMMILIVHYKSGRVKTKHVRIGSPEFKAYAKYIK